MLLNFILLTDLGIGAPWQRAAPMDPNFIGLILYILEGKFVKIVYRRIPLDSSLHWFLKS